MADVRVFRGQKIWDPRTAVTAASLRRSLGPGDPEAWTDGLLQMVADLLALARGGDLQARADLENQLLTCQQVAFQNPYVSCTHERAVALSFALYGSTPGYILTIDGELAAGVDFQAIRAEFAMFGDAVDHLREFGIPRDIRAPFEVAEVHLVDPSTLKMVQVV